MEFFWTYLDAGLKGRPGDALDQTRLMRARLVNGVTALFIAISSPFVLVHLAAGRIMTASSLMASIILAAANVWLLRKTHRVSLCGLIFASLILAHLSTLALEVRHPAIAYWFFMIPLLGTLLGGLRTGWLLTGVVLLVALYQELVPLESSRDLTSDYVFAMRVVSTLCVAVFMTIFATAQRAAERSQSAANEELRAEAARGKLMREVAVAANGAARLEDLLDTCVTSVCRLAKWPVGVAWTVGDWDEEGGSTAWHLQGHGFGALRTRAEAIWSEGRCILAERSSEQTRPSWIESLATDFKPDLEPEPEFEPEFAEALEAEGVSGGIIVPVLDAGEIVARLAFFWGPEARPDPEMLDVLENLSAQVTHVVARIRAHSRIQTLAFFDPLTGLPNRQLFRRRLLSALELAKRGSHSLALLFIDLDGFKSVNDSLGHAAGDQLLKEVARRLVAGVRASDAVLQGDVETGNAVVSRLAGDEFTITLSSLADAHDAGLVARRLLDSLERPFHVAGQEAHISASIGIAIYPIDGDDPEALLAGSDAAMYHAKQMGRNQFQFYTEAMNVHRARALKVEARLRRALEAGEMEDLALHYQPVRDIAGAAIVGAEALLRWWDEELGDVSPAEFVPIAERTGLIAQLGSWVLRTACEQMRCWQDQGYRPFRVSVNISGAQVQSGGLVEEVAALLTANRLSPSHLELELSERTIMQDDDTTRECLEGFESIGVGIAIDDFGVGSSSLSCLRRYSISSVKIDRAFVSGIPDNPGDKALAAAVIAMANSLDLRAVAIGVETLAQVDFLRGHQCDQLQGFLLGRPVPGDEFALLLEREKADEEA